MIEVTQTIYSWPREHIGVVDSTFALKSMNLISQQLFSVAISPYGPVDQRWTCDFNLPPKEAASWRQLSGFISRLKGTAGLLRLSDPMRLRPAYDLEVSPTLTDFTDSTEFTDGTGFVDGYLPSFITLDQAACAGDRSIVVRGLPASAPSVIRMGDLMEARPNGIPTAYGNLYECVNNASTNASGKVRIYIEPGLRRDLAAGDMIVLRNPTTVFRLAKDDAGVVSRSLPSIGRIGLSLVEEVREI